MGFHFQGNILNHATHYQLHFYHWIISAPRNFGSALGVIFTVEEFSLLTNTSAEFIILLNIFNLKIPSKLNVLFASLQAVKFSLVGPW
jgi:hypothetical protein